VLGLGGDFFIALDTPWWSPLSDDRWTWPLFSKEWPLTDPIGISAAVADYELGSGKVPEIQLKKPEFDPSKFMTSMVDKTLPEKSGGAGAGHGTFKEDGTVPKPVVPPKKPAPKAAAAKPPKKGAPLKGGKSASPDPKAAKEKQSGKILQSAAKPLGALKAKEALTRGELDKELAKIKAQVSGIEFGVQVKSGKWLVIPKAGGKTSKGVEIAAKQIDQKDKDAKPGATGKATELFGKGDKKDERTDKQKQEDLEKALTEADSLLQDEQTPLGRLKKKLASIKATHKMTSLEFVIISEDITEGRENVQTVGEINPRGSRPARPHNLRQLVSSLNPINYAHRGHIITIVSGPLKGTRVRYNALGFPDFSPFSIKKVTIQMHGNRSYRVPDGDFGNANEKAGYDRNGGEPAGYTWHHHEDRRTMLLVDTRIHDAFRHSGGVWVVDQLGEK
jgi:hypothetical protein